MSDRRSRVLTFSKYAGWFFTFFLGVVAISGVIQFVAGIATTDLKKTLVGFVSMLLGGLLVAVGLIGRNPAGGGPESDPRKPPP